MDLNIWVALFQKKVYLKDCILKEKLLKKQSLGSGYVKTWSNIKFIIKQKQNKMAGIGDYDPNKPFELRSSNKPKFKMMGSVDHQSPLTWHKKGHEKGLFQSIHGAITGTEGKKFKETKVGSKIMQDLSNVKQKAVKTGVETKLKTGKDKDLTTKVKDVKGPGTEDLLVHKSSSGSGVIKPSGKDKQYTAHGGTGYTFTRGGGDPYQYRTKDEGKTYQYKKVGEHGWSDVKGGFDLIKTSYEKSKKNN